MTLMRVQRALAQAGIASRRAAETLIEDGVVRVDGEVATLGSKVDPDKQTITVTGKRVTQKPRRWIALSQAVGRRDDRKGRGRPPHRFRFPSSRRRAHLCRAARRDDDGAPAAHHRRRRGGAADPSEVPCAQRATPPWCTGAHRRRSPTRSSGRWSSRDGPWCRAPSGCGRVWRGAALWTSPSRKVASTSFAAGPRRWDSRWIAWPGSPTDRFVWASCRSANGGPQRRGGEGDLPRDQAQFPEFHPRLLMAQPRRAPTRPPPNPFRSAA